MFIAFLLLSQYFSQYFYCLVWLRYEFTQGKVQLRLYIDVYDACMAHYVGGTVNVVSL